jgi:hypothetical protein
MYIGTYSLLFHKVSLIALGNYVSITYKFLWGVEFKKCLTFREDPSSKISLGIHDQGYSLEKNLY